MTKILFKNIFILLISFLFFFSPFSFLYADPIDTATNIVNNISNNTQAFSNNDTSQILLENYGGLFSTNMEELQSDPSVALAKYIDLIVKIAFGLGSIAAVALIVWGGMDYIGESFTKKIDGKNKIIRGIGAIVLLAVAFIFFQKVNPETLIVRFNPVNSDISVASSNAPNITTGPSIQSYKLHKIEAEKSGYIEKKMDEKEDCETWQRENSIQQQYLTPDFCIFDGSSWVSFYKKQAPYHREFSLTGLSVQFGGGTTEGALTQAQVLLACKPVENNLKRLCTDFKATIATQGGKVHRDRCGVISASYDGSTAICTNSIEYFSFYQIFPPKPPSYGSMGPLDVFSITNSFIPGGTPSSISNLLSGTVNNFISSQLPVDISLTSVMSSITNGENLAGLVMNEAMMPIVDSAGLSGLTNTILGFASSQNPVLSTFQNTIQGTLDVEDLAKEFLNNTSNPLYESYGNQFLNFTNSANPFESINDLKQLSNEILNNVNIDSPELKDLANKGLALAVEYQKTGNLPQMSNVLENIGDMRNLALNQNFEELTVKGIELLGFDNDTTSVVANIAGQTFDIKNVTDLIYHETERLGFGGVTNEVFGLLNVPQELERMVQNTASIEGIAKKLLNTTTNTTSKEIASKFVNITQNPITNTSALQNVNNEVISFMKSNSGVDSSEMRSLAQYSEKLIANIKQTPELIPQANTLTKETRIIYEQAVAAKYAGTFEKTSNLAIEWSDISL
ncbi:MAG: hypothetical protein KAI16_00300 [Candidatus Pacebacteria bacterium]|nr:hypothetical protein [Candidatus Paceibacterota bacterium]